MKHTDLAILFFVIFLSFITEYDFKMNALCEIQNQGMIYNNIFDTAVSDALRNGLELKNNEIRINEELVTKQLLEGLNELMTIDMTAFPAMIITNDEGFTVWNNGVRSEVIYADSQLETKINAIKKAVEEALNSSTAAKYNKLEYTISIPYCDVNEWYNTISDLGFLVVFQGDTFHNDKLFNRYIVSGASFKYSDSR